MGVFADKLQESNEGRALAFEARFVSLAHQAIRSYPDSVVDALRYMGEQWLYEYLRGLMKDRGGKEQISPRTPLMKEAQYIAAPRPNVTPYRPRPKRVPMPKSEAIKKLQEIIFGYKIADGRDIAEVGVHESARFIRDGVLFHELQKELPVLTGNMKFANYGELLTKKQFDAARARAKL